VAKHTHYVNTDLDLASDRDLAPIVAAFAPRGVSAINAFRDELSRFRVGFEANSCHGVEATIVALLDAIESLASTERELWNSCSSRVLDVAYDCGSDGPTRFVESISHATLARIARNELSLTITLYRHPAED